MAYFKCEICGRPARYHDTSLQNGVATERHLCGLHGRQLWYGAFKEVLSNEVGDLPSDWLPVQVSKRHLKKHTLSASTMQQLAASLRPK